MLKINDMIHHYTAALAWGGRTTEGKPAYPTASMKAWTAHQLSRCENTPLWAGIWNVTRGHEWNQFKSYGGIEIFCEQHSRNEIKSPFLAS